VTVLGIDTTGAFGSLALLRGGEVLELAVVHAPEGFAHEIFGEIEALLARQRVALSGIDLFAAASGPGSFTGVRVGLAAAKGLAAALGKPAAGVSNLAALASLGTGPLRAALLDARRGEVYGAVYSAAGELIVPEMAGTLQAFLERVPPGAIFTLPETGPFDAFLPAGRVYTGKALAAAVAKLARPADPALLDANYVRRADAELKWVDR